MIDTFGSRLERLRKGLTLDQVGKIANTNRAAAHNWVNDKAIPTAPATLLLARHFNVSPYYLIFGEEDTEQLNKRFDRFTSFFKKIDKLEKDKIITQENIIQFERLFDMALNMANDDLNKLVQAYEETQKTA